MRTACALMVMPRSRSRSMSSRIWACISRPVTEPVSSSSRSLSVDLPWSMWAMMAKLRINFEFMVQINRGNRRATPRISAHVRREAFSAPWLIIGIVPKVTPIEAAPACFHGVRCSTPGAGLHPAAAALRRLHADRQGRRAGQPARAGHRAAASGSRCAAARRSARTQAHRPAATRRASSLRRLKPHTLPATPTTARACSPKPRYSSIALWI